MICCSPFSPDMMFTCSFLGWLLLPLSSRFSPLIKGSLIQPKHTPSMHQNQTQPQSIKIHVFTRPQTYNKQQACIRIQHIPNPCCTISARWKEWNWFFPPWSRCKLSTMCCKSEIRCNSCKDRTRAYSWVFMNQISSLDTYTLCIWYMNIGVLFFDDAHYFKSSK